MKNKKILALTVLLLSVVYLLLSVSLIVGNSADHNDQASSDQTDGITISTLSDTTATQEGVSDPTSDSDTCSHILSAEWFSSDGHHFHKCVMPDCNFTDSNEACSGGNSTCTEKAICQVCSAPYGTPSDHIPSAEWDYTDTDGHAHNCTFGCGWHSELLPHVPGPAATEQAPQVCVDCNYVIADILEHIHTLKMNAAQNASCTNYGSIEYYTCSGCSKLFYDSSANNEITDLFSIRTAALEHDFAAATCTHAKTCQRNNCNATEGLPLGHSPNAAWESDPDAHWHICTTCGERTTHATHTPGPAATEQSPQLCTVCGYILKAPTAHIHNYGTVLKYNSDSHWYECTCGQINNKQTHTDTNKNGKCDICGYQLPTAQQGQTTTSDKYANEIERIESILQPAQITLLRPVASGVLTKSTSSAIIDYSNSKDGYIMVKYTENTSVKLKVQVQGPTTNYTYNLYPQQWSVLPLSDGNGKYNIKVFKNVVENRYSAVLSLNMTVALSDEFSPFLRPNQYVNFENAVNTMNKAAELAAGKSDTLEKVKAIYTYIINNISYDYEKAATVQSGYLPNLDQVLAEKKGICFDYAALMAGMLRSQNIACKLIVGYADTTYHAWISVWTPDKGWIDSAIFFDGIKWQLMDPTYASSVGSAVISQVTYTSKYIY